MPTPDTAGVPPFADFDMLKAKINEIVAKYNNLLVNLDSLNVVSITANSTTITANLDTGAYILLDGNGMVVNNGSYDTFVVDINGNVTMTSATIQTQSGYPKVELDPDTNLFRASLDATTYLEIVPNFDGTSPIMRIVSSGSTRAQFNIDASNRLIVGGGTSVVIQGGDVELTPETATGKKVKIPSFSVFVDSLGNDLQTSLNSKANGSGASGTYYVSSTNGGPTDTAITVSNGVIQP